MTSGIPVRGPLPVVAFICIHNAGRSQMAAGLLRTLGGDRVDVRSAGSTPRGVVNPAAVAAMGELGIDISQAIPRRWSDDDLADADVVITMGCGDDCPFVPDTLYEDWPLKDPAGQGVDAVRPIRAEIERRVEHLMARLGLTP